jgi:uncharacterized membrane protein
MLIVHFIGIAMGVGTSLAFMFLGIASSKLSKEEATKITLHNFALSKMGQIGLVLLLVSGGYLMTPYWGSLGANALLVIKLTLFVVLGAVIGMVGAKAKKAKLGDTDKHLNSIKTLGSFAMLLGLTIIVLAVLVFH